MDVSDIFNLLVAVIIIGSSVLSTFVTQKKKAEKKRKGTIEDDVKDLFGEIFSPKKQPEKRDDELETITKSIKEPPITKYPGKAKDPQDKTGTDTISLQSPQQKKRPAKLHPSIHKKQEILAPVTLDSLVRNKSYSPAQKMIILDTILNRNKANRHAIQAPAIRKS